MSPKQLLIWFWFMKKDVQSLLNYNNEQEGKSLGAEREQAEAFILLNRSTDWAGGLHLPFPARVIFDVWRNVSCFTFKLEQSSHGRKNCKESMQKTVEGW